MNKDFSIKKFFVRLLIILPLIYIGFGWWIGVNYGQKSVIFGPYADIPIVVKTSLLGSSLEDISGSKALVMVVPPKEADKSDQDATYFKISGYFEVPGTWNFDFSPSGNDILLPKTFAMTGSYSRAIFYELKNPRHRLGSLSVRELYDLLKEAGRTKDTLKLMPYLFISRYIQSTRKVSATLSILSTHVPAVLTYCFGKLVLIVAFTTPSIKN